jgi:hypothetical protein
MPTDTFTIPTTGGVDGTGAITGATYPPVTTFTNNDGIGDLYANRGYSGSTTYHLDNTLMYFTTSTLPDTATVTAAELEIYVTEIVNTNTLSVIGEYYSYDGSTAVGDITSDEVGGAFAAVGLTDMGVGQQIFTLTNVSNISLSGNTGFRLKITQRAANAAPTGHNYFVAASDEHATQAGPILRVTYTDGASPSYFQLLGIS